MCGRGGHETYFNYGRVTREVVIAWRFIYSFVLGFLVLSERDSVGFMTIVAN